MTRDQSNDTNLPPWLRGVPLPPRPSEAPGGALGSFPAAPAPAADEATDLPDWLRGLSETPAAPAAPAADTSADLPDWLSGSGAETPAAPVQPPPPSTADRARSSGFTGWLISGDAPAPAPTPPPPTPMPPPSAPPPMPRETREAESIPSWLRESAAADQSADEEPEEQLPDWLRDLAPRETADHTAETQNAPPGWLETPTPAPAPPAEEPVPGWLQAADATPQPQPPAPEPAAASAAEQELPDWLGRYSEEDLRQASDESDSDLGVTPFALEGEPPADLPPAGDIPAWLREAAGDAPRPTGEATEWLSASASQLIRPQPSAPATPEAETGDIPAWLREAAGDAPRPTGEATEWLSASASQLIRPQPSAPATPEAETGDIPAWLRGSEPSAAPAPAPAELPEEPEIPSWFSSAAGVPPPEPAAEEVPAWLRAGEPAAGVPPPEPAAEEVPAWLRAGEPAAGVPPEPVAPEATPAPTGEDLPAWLRDTAAPTPTPSDDLPPWLRDESGAPLPTAGAPGDANLPDWLRGAEADAPTPSAGPTVPPSPPASRLGLLDDSQAPTPPANSEILGGADLPAWLRRETERPRDTTPADARSLDWLARLGSLEDENVQAVSAEPAPRLSLPAPRQRTQAQIEALALLRHMAAEPLTTPSPLPAAAPTGALGRIGLERIVSLILLALIVAALVLPGLADGLMAGTPPAPQAEALLNQIRQLGEDDTVLIGYEWDAQRISELRPLERAVIDQLIAQNVKVVLVSTDPQGALLQFDLRDRLTAAGYQGGGDDYILLGYRPGGEISLRLLAQDLRGALRSDFQGRDATFGLLATEPGTQRARLATLDDFAMMLVLADEPTDVQGWMEQIKPATQRPIGFLIPASVEPFAMPYFRRPSVFYLAGTQGALAYEQLRGGDQSDLTARATGQLRLATLLFAALLFLGAVGVLVNEAARRRRSEP